MASTVISSGGSTWGAIDTGLATYVNGAEILTSQWEFTLLFSQVSATPRPEQAGAEPAYQVTKSLVGRFAMSPQHAKAFVEAMHQNVRSYEEQFGEIPLFPQERAVPPPEEAVRRVVEAAGPEPEGDLPTEPPATSPEESSNGA